MTELLTAEAFARELADNRPETLAAATYASCFGVFWRASLARSPDLSSPTSTLPSPPARSASRGPSSSSPTPSHG